MTVGGVDRVILSGRESPARREDRRRWSATVPIGRSCNGRTMFARARPARSAWALGAAEGEDLADPAAARWSCRSWPDHLDRLVHGCFHPVPADNLRPGDECCPRKGIASRIGASIVTDLLSASALGDMGGDRHQELGTLFRTGRQVLIRRAFRGAVAIQPSVGPIAVGGRGQFEACSFVRSASSARRSSESKTSLNHLDM